MWKHFTPEYTVETKPAFMRPQAVHIEIADAKCVTNHQENSRVYSKVCDMVSQKILVTLVLDIFWLEQGLNRSHAILTN